MDVREEEQILRFLDSFDSYVSLHHRLSSTLRQGWLDIAVARHSVGSSRISSALYDLKEHQAASVLQVNECKDDADQGPSYSENTTIRPHFTLVKWGAYEDRPQLSGDEEVKGTQEECSNGSDLRHRDYSGAQGVCPLSDGPLIIDSQVEKLRSKSLSVFGALVTPKLRSAQLSFETALEMLVEMANVRSTMQFAFAQLQQNKLQACGDTSSKEIQRLPDKEYADTGL